MALTASRQVDRFVDQELRTFRVKGTTKIYRGAFLGITSAGVLRGLVAGDVLAGISYEEIDNSAGADGAKVARVFTLSDFQVSVSGAAQTDVGRPVFASADDALTFVATSNSYVGIVQDFLSTGVIILRLDPQRRAIKTVTHAVENLGAGADIAARAIHGFDADAWIVSTRIVNQATSAAGIDAGNTCVVALACTAGAVASKTFTNAVVFPAANTANDLGTITNPHCPKNDVVTVAVTQGATADAGPFLVEVDYV